MSPTPLSQLSGGLDSIESLRTGALKAPPLATPPVGIVIEFDPPLPQPRPEANFVNGITDWGVMLNDRIGNCVVACMAHLIGAWTSNATGVAHIVSDATVLDIYSSITGYTPSTGANDNGMRVSAGFDFWRSHGIEGHTLLDYKRIPYHQIDVRRSIAEFGACVIAFGVNDYMLGQFVNRMDWTYGYGPADSEFHCVPLIAYDNDWAYGITWGRVQRMWWTVLDSYVKEVYVPIGDDWFRQDGLSVSGRTRENLKGLSFQMAANWFGK